MTIAEATDAGRRTVRQDHRISVVAARALTFGELYGEAVREGFWLGVMHESHKLAYERGPGEVFACRR